MTKLQTKITTAIATSAVLLNSVAGVAFAGSYTIGVSGNGDSSNSDVQLNVDSGTGVWQENSTAISNDISVTSNTGDNTASRNTNGDVDVNTGSAYVDAILTNSAGHNVAEVDNCDCDNDVDVDIHGNGVESDNDVAVNLDDHDTIDQDNRAYVRNNLDLDGNTGRNRADRNTSGNLTVWTGDAVVTADVANLAGTNAAVIGGGAGSDGSTIDLDISANGDRSDNDLAVNIGQDRNEEDGIFQDNRTRISNDFWFGANSGENRANRNTLSWEGVLDIDTGAAVVTADIDNASGFNAASVDCGCELEISGSIDDNGVESANNIVANFDDELNVVQNNRDRTRNHGDVESDSGRNRANRNTNGSTTVWTGIADSLVDVANDSGTNVFGSYEIVWPWAGFFE